MLKSIVIIPSCHNTKQLLAILGAFPGVEVNEICLEVDCINNEELHELQKAADKLQIPVHIATQPKRRGVGFAIRHGIDYAVKKQFDVVVVMAGNGKDQPNEIPRLLNPILNEGYDYIQGSRFLPGGKRVKNPLLRRLFSQLFPFLWTLLTNIRCTDVTNGFRAYRLNLFENEKINLWQSWLEDYQLEYYIHYKVLTLGYKTKEVPVSKIYPFNYKGGYSNIRPIEDWWKIVSPLIYLKMGIKQ